MNNSPCYIQPLLEFDLKEIEAGDFLTILEAREKISYWKETISNII